VHQTVHTDTHAHCTVQRTQRRLRCIKLYTQTHMYCTVHLAANSAPSDVHQTVHTYTHAHCTVQQTQRRPLCIKLYIWTHMHRAPCSQLSTGHCAATDIICTALNCTHRHTCTLHRAANSAPSAVHQTAHTQLYTETHTVCTGHCADTDIICTAVTEKHHQYSSMPVQSILSR